MPANLFVLMIDLLSKLLFIENAAYEFIKAILKEYKYCIKVMSIHFNENLIMSEKEENLFQQSNSCWICKILVDNDKKKLEIIVT